MSKAYQIGHWANGTLSEKKEEKVERARERDNGKSLISTIQIISRGNLFIYLFIYLLYPHAYSDRMLLFSDSRLTLQTGQIKLSLQ